METMAAAVRERQLQDLEEHMFEAHGARVLSLVRTGATTAEPCQTCDALLSTLRM